MNFPVFNLPSEKKNNLVNKMVQQILVQLPVRINVKWDKKQSKIQISKDFFHFYFQLKGNPANLWHTKSTPSSVYYNFDNETEY